MDIRQLRNDEFDASTALSEYAFQYTMTPEQKEASRANFKPEQYWGIFDEEELQAKLTILPLRIYLQGRKLDMGGSPVLLPGRRIADKAM
ncbi:acetyltransferase, GNAT family [Paenibacillus sp. JCM 10914]|nr:acetyltransferase, GNAT family [Paenibacillus sp. JCM 10914]